MRSAVPRVVIAHAILVKGVTSHPFILAVVPVTFIGILSSGPAGTRAGAVIDGHRVGAGDDECVPPVLVQGFGDEVGGEKLEEGFCVDAEV